MLESRPANFDGVFEEISAKCRSFSEPGLYASINALVDPRHEIMIVGLIATRSSPSCGIERA
jgi:hypothetical protein